VNVVFDLGYKFADYATSAAALGTTPDPSPEMTKFVARRLKEINGMSFLDYNDKYRIELPKNWDKLK